MVYELRKPPSYGFSTTLKAKYRSRPDRSTKRRTIKALESAFLLSFDRNVCQVDL